MGERKIVLTTIALLSAATAASLLIVHFKREVLRMKRFWMVPVVVLLLMVVFFAPLPACADDSGDERVVPVIRWVCFQCGKEYFTFAPDNIDGKAKTDHKMVNYQQSNWVLLGDPGKSVPKCEKSPDGAHFFEKKQELNTSPYIIHELRNYYIVLKNGGSLKAKIIKWKCMSCGINGFCFLGDDMDSATSIRFDGVQKVYNMKSGSRINECRLKNYRGDNIKCHMFDFTDKIEPKSFEIAKSLSNMWYSD